MGAENPSPWSFPAGIQVAGEVSLDAVDPALDGGRRRCVAERKAGGRCRVNAIAGEVLCPAHAGRLDGVKGGHAKAAKLRLVREEQTTRAAESRMGARAIIASRAVERASDLRRAFDVVVDDALTGNKQSARTLLNYLTAAFPEQQSQTAQPADIEALTTLGTDELRALAFGTTDSPESETS